MEAQTVLDVVKRYREFFRRRGYPAERLRGDEGALFWKWRLGHCHWMLDSIERFARDGEMGKVFRWLGFVQGCLWATGCYTIDEMRHHNKPELAETEEPPTPVRW